MNNAYINYFIFLALILITKTSALTKDGSRNFSIIHVTDIHGWVDGHPHEDLYNSDFGDFRSLLDHMKENYRREGTELLIFDTGDLIEGTGLSDVTKIHGENIFPIVKKIELYHGLTVGNHDLEDDGGVLLLAEFARFWNGTYVTSNTFLRSTNTFLGSPYYLLSLDSGYKILILGYIYDFLQNSVNSRIVPINESVTQPYFTEALNLNADMIVVLAHVDMTDQKDQVDQIYNAIRNKNKNTPLILLSGHGHVKAYQDYDENCFSIESGCYFKEIAQINFTIGEDGNMYNVKHSWITTSLDHLMGLAEVNSVTEFTTPNGKETTKLINDLSSKLHLDEIVGCSPITYDIHYNPPDPSSVYTFEIEQINPKIVYDYSRPSVPYFITGSGTLRYSIFEGPVNVNDIYTTNPFSDTYMYYSLKGYQIKKVKAVLESEDGLQLLEDIAEGLGTGGPPVLGKQWFYSNATLDDNQLYDLIGARYMINSIFDVIKNLFPDDSSVQVYPTKENTTSAIQKYFTDFLPC